MHFQAFVPNDRKVFGSNYKAVPLSPSGCNWWQMKKFSTVIYITKTHTKALDRPDKRCIDDKSTVNASACIASFIEKEVGCNPMILGSTYSKASACTTRSQLIALVNISKQLEKADEKDIYDMTGCLSPCQKDRFSLSADLLKQGEAYQSLGEVPCQLQLEFQILDSSYQVEEEYVLYEMDSFIADVGGYMGLLLGSSLLSIYMTLEECIRKISRMGGV